MLRKITSKTERQIDGIFAQWDHPGSPGCAVAITGDGRIIYERGYGRAQLEYDIPITSDTVFHVASLSKQFTAWAAALLAVQGLLDWDADLRHYLPEMPDFGFVITPRHLVHHTSGLRDQWELLKAAGWRLDDVITKDHLYKMITRQRELNFPPGAEYLYCNTGYTLLAGIVERVTGQTLRQFAQKNIFQPLEMLDTHFHDDHQEIVQNRAYSYEPKGSKGWRKSVLNYANVGATSLFTTASDLSKWLANLDEGRVGGPAVLHQMEQKYVLRNGQTIPYGFGLMFEEYKGWEEIGHSGSDAGFRSWCGRIKPHGLGLIVLANSANVAPRELARRLAELLLTGKIEEERRREIKPAVTLTPADCVGTYYLEQSGERLLITQEKDSLFAHLGEAPKPEPLFSQADGNYQGAESGVKITFRGDSGAVEGCLWQWRGMTQRGRKKPDYRGEPGSLKVYVGSYYSPELDSTYRLVLRGGRLICSFQRHPDLNLVPWGPHHFLCPSQPLTEFTFEEDTRGISGFSLEGGRIRGVRFKRIKEEPLL